jgi:hypothetical protein
VKNVKAGKEDENCTFLIQLDFRNLFVGTCFTNKSTAASLPPALEFEIFNPTLGVNCYINVLHDHSKNWTPFSS